MRIAVVTHQYPPDTDWGGVATYYETLVPYLAMNGHEVTVITWGRPARSYVERGVKVRRIPPKRPFPGLSMALGVFSLHHVLYQWAVDSVLTELRPDIVLTPESMADCGVYLARPRRRRAPVIVQLMSGVRMLSTLNAVPPKQFGGWSMLLLEQWVVLRADCLSTLSQAKAEWARDNLRLASRPIEVIANPVDILHFRPNLTHADDHLVLYVGRLQWGKGCHILAQAINRILRQMPETRFRFVGKDTQTAPGERSMKRYLEEILRAGGALGSVSFADHCPRADLPAEYGAAAVCVVPSFWETFGNVCLEAMACGKAVVASRAGGLAEAIEDNTSGLLVPPGDPESLATQIIGLLRNPAERDRLGRAARARAEERYRPDRIARQMVALMQRTIDRH